MGPFLDTNVLLYSISNAADETKKRDRALDLMDRDDCVLSVQVLQEFYVQATRASRPDPLPHDIAVGLIRTWLRFQIRTTRKGGLSAPCEARATGRRSVTDSGGHTTTRWFILTEVELAGRRFTAEVNLTDRRHMLFPLLLGRTALDGRFAVDSSLSYSQTPRRAVRDPS